MAYIRPVDGTDPPHFFKQPTKPSSKAPPSAHEAERVKQGLKDFEAANEDGTRPLKKPE